MAKASLIPASALWLYGFVVVWGAASGGGPIVSQSPGEVLARAAVATALGAALVLRTRFAVATACVFAAFFGLWGLVSLAGQLSQRYLPDSAGMYISLNPVAFTVTLASTAFLLVVLVACAPRLRTATPSPAPK